MPSLSVTVGSFMSAYAASQRWSTLATRLHPTHTALVIVDMQNDFCAAGGYIEKLGMDVSGYPDILPPIRSLLAAARSVGVPVIWLVACYEDGLVPPAMAVKKQAMGVEAICCARGTWGAKLFGLDRAENEVVIEKHTFSGFSNPEFAQVLEKSGTDSLVFCGVQTNVCVEATLRDAHSRGFYVTLAADAVASHTKPLHDATIANVRFLIGDVVTSEQLAGLWTGAKAE
jgi:ureidoacrylate peracid hydrolase